MASENFYLCLTEIARTPLMLGRITWSGFSLWDHHQFCVMQIKIVQNCNTRMVPKGTEIISSKMFAMKMGLYVLFQSQLIIYPLSRGYWSDYCSCGAKNGRQFLGLQGQSADAACSIFLSGYQAATNENLLLNRIHPGHMYQKFSGVNKLYALIGHCLKK